MDSLRTRNEALEAQIREKQENYKKGLEELQVTISSSTVAAAIVPGITPAHTRVNSERALNITHTDTEPKR